MKKVLLILLVIICGIGIVGCKSKTEVSKDSKITTSENLEKEKEIKKENNDNIEEKTNETTTDNNVENVEKQEDTNKQQKEIKKETKVTHTKKKTNYSSLKKDINSLYSQDYGNVRIEKYDDMIELWFENCSYDTVESIRSGELTSDMIDTDYYYLSKAVINRTGCERVGMIIAYDAEVLYQHGMDAE